MMARDFLLLEIRLHEYRPSVILQSITALHSLSVTSHLAFTAVLGGRRSRCMILFPKEETKAHRDLAACGGSCSGLWRSGELRFNRGPRQAGLPTMKITT